MISHIYQNPNKYSQNNALQYNFAMKLLSKISFDNQSRVLDIGCGDGVITNEIASIVPDGCVIGSDISHEMVEFAGKKFIKQNNLRFIAMDASKNIFREQFDIITSFNCLHWVKDQQEALTGIANSALPGAQIALLLSHKKSNYHVALDIICSSTKWKEYFIHFTSPRSYFDPNDYRQLIIKSGLQLIELHEEEMTYSFKSKDQVKDFFSAAGSQIKYIPEIKKNEFLTDFIDEYLRVANISVEDFIPVSFWCLQIIASKPKLGFTKVKNQENQASFFSQF